MDFYFASISKLELTFLILVYCRHGASAGALAGNKSDGNSQQNNIGSRILSKTADMDYTAQPNERRERHAGIEKERVMVKGIK